MRLSRLQRLLIPILRAEPEISHAHLCARLWALGESYDERSVRLALMRLEQTGVIVRQRGRGRQPSRYDVR